MILHIPLFSPPLLVSAALIALGFIAYVISARVGVALIGAGSLIMGLVAINDLPKGFEAQGLALFGISAVVVGWMMYVAVKNG
jgi:hypothetical protein